MSKLECFSIDGVFAWFWPNDHEPPHFHAKRRGEWEAKVYFLKGADEMFELVWATKKLKMPKSDRVLLRELVEAHRLEILKEWERKVQAS